MQLIYTEKLVKTENSSEFLTLHPIYKIISVFIGTKSIKIPFYDGKRVIFGEIPQNKDIYVTYISDNGTYGRCLTYEMMKTEYYKMKYNTESIECLDYGDQGIDTYIKEAINILQTQSSNKRFIKQYNLNIGNVYYSCDTSSADDFVPRYGMLLTDTGMYIKYNKVKGKIKPILDVKTTINDFHIGYELPDIGKIQNITADGREIDFKQYQGYFFFDTKSCGCGPQTTISVNYYSDLSICDNGCIEFEEIFWRIPVLYALFKIGVNLGDERRYEWQKDYQDLVEVYKKYLLFKTDNREKFVSEFTLPNTFRSHSRPIYPYKR